MPFADFQPSNAGAQLNDQILRNVDFGVSMMERANRNAALLQDVEQRKQRFVQDQILGDQQIQQNRLRLAEMEGSSAARAAQNRAAVASADGAYRAATTEAETYESNSKLLAQASLELPAILTKLESANDENEMVQTVAPFLRKYTHLAKHPVLGPKFAAIEGEVAGRLESGVQAVKMQSFAAAAGLRRHLDRTDPTAIARVRNSPFFDFAMKDEAFSKEFGEAQKAVAEHVNKIAEQKSKTNETLREVEAKADADIRVNDAKASSDRKEAPQYLVEKAMKVDQSDKDLTDLETQFAKMTTGPVLGFFRGMNPYDTDARAFEAKLKAAVPNLARGVFGEVGVLTDADIKNYMATLPNLRSPQERAAKLVEQLRAVLERQRTNLSGVIEGQGYKTGGLPGFQKKPETRVTGGSDLQARIAAEKKRRGQTGLAAPR